MSSRLGRHPSATDSPTVSLRGDPPGFVMVLDYITLAIRERSGDRRVDGCQDIIENPHAGLTLSHPRTPRDAARQRNCPHRHGQSLFDDMLRGHRPALALVVAVDEAFFHS